MGSQMGSEDEDQIEEPNEREMEVRKVKDIRDWFPGREVDWGDTGEVAGARWPVLTSSAGVARSTWVDCSTSAACRLLW